MPSGRLSVNVVTEKDAKDIDYIAKNLDPEFVAASFIGSGEVGIMYDLCLVLSYIPSCIVSFSSRCTYYVQ